jgi:FAD:protein FMN transferase
MKPPHLEGMPTPRARLRGGALVLALVALALLVRWSRSGAGDPVHELVGPTMGTSFRVLIAADLAEGELDRTRRLVEERLDSLSRLMSTYDATSEISRFNRHASTEPVAATPELIDVLTMAREVSERSGGAFDVTVGPLVEAWGFGPGGGIDGPSRPTPSEGEVERLRQVAGYDRVVIDRAAGTAAKTHPESWVDLSGIAKGYAADAVAAVLAEEGLTSFLVEVGGELAGRGTRAGRPWRVGIERPDDTPGVWATVELDHEGIATSGDYRDYYEEGGLRYAHIIDPRTGRPVIVRGASVSVIHPSAAMADAWATALTVLGPEEGYEVAVREGLAAVFVYAFDGEVRSAQTPAFEDRPTATIR